MKNVLVFYNDQSVHERIREEIKARGLDNLARISFVTTEEDARNYLREHKEVEMVFSPVHFGSEINIFGGAHVHKVAIICEGSLAKTYAHSEMEPGSTGWSADTIPKTIERFL